MKKIICILLAMLPLLVFANDIKNNKDDKYNPKYLAGAVTVNQEGKVVFSKEIRVPHKSKETLYKDLLAWSKERFQMKDGMHSRVIYTDPEKGIIASTAEEYIVFYSTAIALDRTRIYYQFTIYLEEGKCKMEMSKIHYLYDENRDGGERYTAEEWIVDKTALNKKKTKLAPISGKFRRETVDLKDALFASVIDAVTRGDINKIIETSTAKSSEVETIPAIPLQPAKTVKKDLSETNLAQLPANLSDIAASGRITITAGEEEIDIKAESWGGFGKLFNKDVTYTLIDKSRVAASLLMEQSKAYKISFYELGETKPSVVLECKKSMKQELTSDELKSLNSQIDINKQYIMYIGEVTRCMAR